MLTFSDLLTLLLTFFVLRIAMSTLDSKKLDQMFEATRVARQAHDEAKEKSPTEKISEGLSDLLGTPRPLQAAPSVVEFNSEIRLKPTPDGALVYLGGNTFESASDVLTDAGRVAVRQIARVLLADVFVIDIAGHTDSDSIRSARFPSNWELSTARAITVGRELISLGIEPHRLSVVGYADTKPTASNETEEGRARNRRVELFINVPAKQDADTALVGSVEQVYSVIPENSSTGSATALPESWNSE
jgi:chemotaxis protein MotB